ncbi:Uncharacterized protein HZ326_20141, partial [Fusarium oxysporum f. sp. albedinis]
MHSGFDGTFARHAVPPLQNHLGHSGDGVHPLGKIQADEMSVQEYAESLLERIKARDEDVKAWAYLDKKRV